MEKEGGDGEGSQPGHSPKERGLFIERYRRGHLKKTKHAEAARLDYI